MRHKKTGRKLGRDSSHRRAMLRNMVSSFFKHEQIETTDARAKELRPLAEKMITLAKRGDLHARRQALAYMKDKATTHMLFEELKNRYLDRQGGYVRIIKKGKRMGDGAPISIVQLLPSGENKDGAMTRMKAVTSRSQTEPAEKMRPDAEEVKGTGIAGNDKGVEKVVPENDIAKKEEP